MKKPYRHIGSLRIALTLFVFLIMTVSGAIAACVFLLARRFGMIPPAHMATLIPILMVVGSVLLGTALSALVGSQFLRPIRRLSQALDAVSKGDFSVRVPVSRGPEELAALQQSFNHMAEDFSGIEMFRNDFIDSFSHEFKTPIVSIRGFARQLARDSLSEEQRREYIDIIVRESERLSRLSTNVLLLSRLENQQIVTNKTDFYLDEQIRSCILLLEKQWSEKEIEFDLDLEETTYHTNEELLSQVWVNLLGNAIKFSEPGSCVEVICTHADRSVVVSIADHGPGMDEETRQHAFDKFYQGDTSRASEGNGIGLSIVRRICELCGGQITLSSAPGEGTRFTVVLPAAE